jgi:hypothetical protein
MVTLHQLKLSPTLASSPGLEALAGQVFKPARQKIDQVTKILAKTNKLFLYTQKII